MTAPRPGAYADLASQDIVDGNKRDGLMEAARALVNEPVVKYMCPNPYGFCDFFANSQENMARHLVTAHRKWVIECSE